MMYQRLSPLSSFAFLAALLVIVLGLLLFLPDQLIEEAFIPYENAFHEPGEAKRFAC